VDGPPDAHGGAAPVVGGEAAEQFDEFLMEREVEVRGEGRREGLHLFMVLVMGDVDQQAITRKDLLEALAATKQEILAAVAQLLAEERNRVQEMIRDAQSEILESFEEPIKRLVAALQ
jgi:hypothetical protein